MLLLIMKKHQLARLARTCYVGVACAFKDIEAHGSVSNHGLRRLNLPHLRRDTRRSQTPPVRTDVTTMRALPMAVTDRSYRSHAEW